jgi:ABC-type nickel/cobalt efflux system permease component RcnA
VRWERGNEGRTPIVESTNEHQGSAKDPRLRAGRTLLILALAMGALLSGSVRPAAAHPLGNFSVNQYSRVEIGTDEARVLYVLDLAELPTVADTALVDGDGDGTIDAAERERYLDGKLAEVMPALHVTADGGELPLRLAERSLSFATGQAGLETTRIEATFTAALPRPAAGAGQIAYRNDYAGDRVGWREIVVTHGPDVRLEDGDDLAMDRSDALRVYPNDLLASPLDERAAAVSYAFAPGAPAATNAGSVSGSGPHGISERLADIVNGGTLSTTGMLLALLAAAAWGALHALSPGHGKTVVGAYLVGSRGTPRHALFLGLTVTITHTAGVLALGMVILFASRTFMPEQLYPWLSLLSGLLVAVLGLTILRQRLLGMPPIQRLATIVSFRTRARNLFLPRPDAVDRRDPSYLGMTLVSVTAVGHHHAHGNDDEHRHTATHDHDHDDHIHDHEHAHAHDLAHAHGGHVHSHLPPGAGGERITWRGLLALGISGGLLPCPSALLALLGAVAVGRAGFGLLVVVAFSVGLAATLTGVGLLFLYAGTYLERRAMAGPLAGLLRFAPAAAALAVTASGVMIVARAIAEIQG